MRAGRLIRHAAVSSTRSWPNRLPAMDGEEEIAWEAVSTDRLVTDPRYWALTPAPPGMASPGSEGLCHDPSEQAHLITPVFD